MPSVDFYFPPLTPSIKMQKSILLSLFVLFTFSLAAVAQESDNILTTSDERLSIETKDKDGLANKGLKLEKEVKPRLPNGFAPLVDAAQKEKIYKIQTDYNTLIAMLELRIELMKKERDAKVNAVLTPEQLQRLNNRPARGSLTR
jgi:Spy/CpxP family protein refolding chaperone